MIIQKFIFFKIANVKILKIFLLQAQLNSYIDIFDETINV